MKNNNKNLFASIFENIRAWQFAALAIMVVSLLRCLRFPNLWSYTHILFNYEFGFTKRGGIGALVRFFDADYVVSYKLFFIFSMLVFIANIALLAIMVFRLIKSGNPMFIMAAFVFVSSFGVGYLAHSVGYADHLALLFVLISFFIKSFYARLIYVFLFMFCIIFVHEGMFVIYYPVVFVSLLMQIGDKNKLLKIILLLSVSLFISVAVFLISRSPLERASAYKMRTVATMRVEKELLEKVMAYEKITGKPMPMVADNLPSVRRDAFNVLHKKPSATFDKNLSFWKRERHVDRFIDSILVTLPTIMLLLIISIKAMYRSDIPRKIIFLAAVSVFSPLSLHLIAWDMHRWNVMGIVTSFVMLGFVSQKVTECYNKQRDFWLLPLILVFVFINGASDIGLFDRYKVKPFPFASHQKYLNDFFYGNESLDYIPQR